MRENFPFCTIGPAERKQLNKLAKLFGMEALEKYTKRQLREQLASKFKEPSNMKESKYKVGQTVLVEGNELLIKEVLRGKSGSEYYYLYDFDVSDMPDTIVFTRKEPDIEGPVYKVGDTVRIKTHEELMATEGVTCDKEAYYVLYKSCLTSGMAPKLGKEITISATHDEWHRADDHWAWWNWMIAEWMGTETSAPCPKCSQLSFRSGRGAIACEKCKTIYNNKPNETKNNEKEDEMKYKKGDKVIIKDWDEIKDHHRFQEDRDYWYAMKTVAGEELTLTHQFSSGGFSVDPAPVGTSNIKYVVHADMIAGLASAESIETKEGWYFSTLEKKLAHGDGRLIMPGVTHSVDGTIETCYNGLHMFPSLDARILQNSQFCGSDINLILWRVEGSGDSQIDSPKVAYRNRKYLWGVHVEGWGINDYKALKDYHDMDEVRRYLRNQTSIDSWQAFEAKQTETIEVPYFEGFQAIGWSKPKEGEYYIGTKQRLERASFDFQSESQLTYEKLAPPVQEVKRGQVWDMDGYRPVLICFPGNKITLISLRGIYDNDHNDTYSSHKSLDDLKEYFQKENAELVAQSLEEYYQEKK